MPLLTGTIADVSGDTIDAADVFEVYLKAPNSRLSGADIDSLVTTSPVNLEVGSGGSISAEVDPGPAVLVIRTFRSLDTFNMIVTGDASTFRDAIVAELGALPELEQSQLIQLANQVRQDALQVEGWHEDVEGWHTDVSGWQDQVSSHRTDTLQALADTVSARDLTLGYRNAAEGFAGDAENARNAATTAQGLAEAARDVAVGHAEDFGVTVSGVTTGAEGSNASVTVTGDGPGYALSFSIPRGDKGDTGEVSQAQLDAAVASLVAGAPEALDTLDELATALGNDPNFAATTAQAIGERAKTSDVDEALEGKSDTGHTHPVGDLSTTGTPSSTTYLNGAGAWSTPPNTTYAVPSQAEAEAGTATTGRAFSAQRARQSANAAIAAKFQVVSALPGSPDPDVIYLVLE